MTGLSSKGMLDPNERIRTPQNDEDRLSLQKQLKLTAATTVRGKRPVPI